MQRFSECEATLCRECEQKDMLIKELEQERETLLKWFKEHITVSLEQFKKYSERMDKSLNEARQQDREIMDQKAAALKEKRARQKLEETLQMSGVLRFIVDRAREHNKIRVSPEETIQEALDKLAQTREFTTILQQEAQARRLNTVIVMNHFHHIDLELWKPTSFKGRPVTVREADFTDYDRAVLVILLKVQSNWPHPLDWAEETSCKEGK